MGGALGNVIWKGWKKNGDDEGAEAAKMVILLHENVSIMDREEEVEEVRMLETADLLKEWVSYWIGGNRELSVHGEFCLALLLLLLKCHCRVLCRCVAPTIV